MPANLTPQYLEAERAFKEAATTADKVAALEHMLAVIPKHKGTEKMQGELRRKLAKLRQESEHARKAGPSRTAPAYYVEKQGAGQAALVGAPNTGKSALVRRLTHATPEVANYPLTTRMAIPGMMAFEDVQIQLVDLPALDPHYGEAWVPQAVRNADAVLLVVDLSAADLLDELENSVALLEKAKIRLGPGSQASLPYGFTGKPVLLVANKADLPGARENFTALAELYSARFPALAVSAETGEGLEAFRRAVFDLLGIIRVYTKEPGKKADRVAPYVLKAGATVSDLAGRVHKDFLARLKYARIWGLAPAGRGHAPSERGHAPFEGQMVNREFRLADGDIVELHA